MKKKCLLILFLFSNITISLWSNELKVKGDIGRVKPVNRTSFSIAFQNYNEKCNEKGEEPMDSEYPMLRIRFSSSIPPNFELQIKEAINEYGYKEDNVIYFWFDPSEHPRLLTFQAEGYATCEYNFPNDFQLERRNQEQEGTPYSEITLEIIQKNKFTLIVKTAPAISGCSVSVNGGEKGLTANDGTLTQEVSVGDDGNFVVAVKKDGYQPFEKSEKWDKKTNPVVIPCSMTIIQQIKKVEVTLQAQQNVSFILIDGKGSQQTLASDTRSHTISWDAGKDYNLRIEAKGYRSSTRTISIPQGIPRYTVTIAKLEPKEGYLNVDSRPAGAEIWLDSELLSETPFHGSVQEGEYKLTLKKTGRYPVERSIKITDEQTLNLGTLEMTKMQKEKKENKWWTSSQFFPHNYLEGYYGMGITADKQINNYAGLSYTYIRHALGFQLSGMYGFNNGDIVATAGPVLTLTKEEHTELDLQLTTGAGYASIIQNDGSRRGTWVVEGSLRFGFDQAIKDRRFSLWSLSLGAKYYDKKIVPTIGMSLMPIGLIAAGAKYFGEESDFAHVFFDPMAGYALKSKDIMVGGHFAWQKYNIGFYTAFLYGISEGNMSIVAGPALHLTPNAYIFDMSLYGGIGYGRTHQGQNTLAGDFGLRFGFNKEAYSWYDLALGCTTFNGEWIPTFGMSLSPIKGIVELARLDEDDFPAHYSEYMMGYAFGSGDFMIGANYSWIQSHLGVYASFLVGINGSVAVNAGPVFRLTPDYCALDLQLYQGIGWSMFDGSAFGAETGLRFGFKYNNRKFGIFSFNVGVNYSADDVALSFGISWPLLGIIGTSGLGALWL